MKKKVIMRAAAVTAALCLALTAGCGNASAESGAYDTAAAQYSGGYADGGIYENAIASDEQEAVAEAAGGDGQDVSETVSENRKLIKTVDMSVETEAFDTLLSNIGNKVKELGGYIENSNVYNGSYTSSYRSRNASITARIPSENLDRFVTDVAEQSNVTDKSESVEDVTLRYVDLESHKKALQAEQESLLSMLENAETIEDIIVINEQLTDVRYQIESMESQLRTYDNQIDFSTVTLRVNEVEQYEPRAEKTAGERIKTGFVRNLHKVGDGISDFFIELIISLPVILTAAVILLAVIAVTFIIIKCGEKSSAKRRAKYMEKKKMQEKQEENKQNGK